MSSGQSNRGRGRGRGRGGTPGSGRGSPAPSVAGSGSGPISRAPSGAGDGGRGGGNFPGQGPRGGGPPGAPPAGGYPRGAAPRGRGGPGGGGGGGPRGGFGGGPPRGGFGGGPPRVFAAGRPVNVDARLSDANLKQLVQKFGQQPASNELPLRPGWGTLGKAGTVRVNFFAVKIPKNVIYDYAVSIAPKAQAGNERRARIFDILESHPDYAPYVAHIAHDRSQRIVSPKPLPQPLSLTVQYLEEGETAPRPNALTFTVEITLTRELDMRRLHDYVEGRPDLRDVDTLPMRSAWDLVLQQHAAKNAVRVGKNRYFFPSLERFPLGLGIEAWKGFFMSVRPTYKEIMVNVNVAMTAFYIPGRLSDAMMAFQNQTGGGMPKSFYDKLKVSTTHLGYVRKRSIASIMSTTARQTKFPCEELGGTVTVEQYFQRKYNIRLQHADDLPVVNLSTDRNKPNFLPAEICEIVPGQAYRGKLGDRETAEMIKYACNPPYVNAESIVNDGFAALGLVPGTAGSILPAFGVSVSREMAIVPKRQLPAPSITYRVGRPNVRDASWNILDVKLHTGGNMTNWGVLLVQDGGREEFRGASDPELVQFLQTFATKCRNSGLTTPNGPPTIMETGRLPPVQNDPGRQRALSMIQETFKKHLKPTNKPAFVLVLLTKVDPFIYPGIKRLCDCRMGMHTVHMQLKKARGDPKKQDQYFSNVTLKVNAKLGGVNHTLDANSMKWLTEKKTMLVGVDVTHPSPGSKKGAPSLAAVVASIDDHFAQFPASLRLQQADWNKEAKEMVERLDEMMVERLMLYQKRNKKFPDRVFVYRDGVSEGQYSQILQHELPLILKAFQRVSPNAPYRPKLTITVCGKRHHARGYPTDANDMDRKGNTPPGTVFDKGITDIYNHDFYLQAHAGLQGQVRPTHYVVVYDEQRLTPDQLQQGTHTASYNYIRATKAVSLVPPAYYADIAAERGRSYLSSIFDAGDDKSSAGTRRSEEEERRRVFEEAVKAWGNGVHEELRESMFYI